MSEKGLMFLPQSMFRFQGLGENPCIISQDLGEKQEKKGTKGIRLNPCLNSKVLVNTNEKQCSSPEEFATMDVS